MAKWQRRGNDALLGYGPEGCGPSVVHVYPLNDLREHDVADGSGGTCWCKPREVDDAPGVWVHNSMDGREEYEPDRDAGPQRKKH